MTQKTIGKIESKNLVKRAYETETARFSFSSQDCALLVIDMQDEFVKQGISTNWIPDSVNIIPRIAKLIETCRKVSIPVIYTIFADTHHRLDRPKSLDQMPISFLETRLDDHRDEIDEAVIKELEPQTEDVVIQKPSYRAFYDTPLDTVLKNLGKNTIIISDIQENRN